MEPPFRSRDACFRHFDARGVGHWDAADCRRFVAALLQAAAADPLADRVLAAFGRDGGRIDARAFDRLWRGVVDPLLRPVSALVVVDVQNDFIDGSLALRDCPARQDGAEVVPVVNALVARGEFAAVAFSMDCHPHDHVSFHDNLHLHPRADGREDDDVRPFDSVVFEYSPEPQVLWPRHCVEGSWGCALHAGLSVPADAVVVRKGRDRRVESYSAFEGGLEGALRSRGVTRAFVCGLALDYCVGATAVGALDRGLPTVVVRDATRGTDLGKMAAVEADVAARGGLFAHSRQVPALADGSDVREEFLRVLLAVEET